MPTHYRGRFAPSPTGLLHYGSLVTALSSFLRARSCGGEWKVRIEDIDTPRVVAGAAQNQLDMLRRLGLDWDGDVLWQSRRDEAYRTALRILDDSGLLFACRCSRRNLRNNIHRQCVSKRTKGPAALRLRLPDREVTFTDGIRGPQTQNLAREVGDVMMCRRDRIITYQLAVVVDDAEQGITEIVRGADLLDSTERQIYLQQCLGLAQPRYAHVPLILDSQHHKLGKSQHAHALDPTQPLHMLRTAWRFLGQPVELLSDCSSVQDTLSVAIKHFSMARVPTENQSLDNAALINADLSDGRGNAGNM